MRLFLIKSYIFIFLLIDTAEKAGAAVWLVVEVSWFHHSVLRYKIEKILPPLLHQQF